MNRFWNPFSNLGFRPEPVSRTLQNLGFLRVPEPVSVPIGPKPFSKLRVPRNRFWNPFYKFRVPRTGSGTLFTNLGFPGIGSGTLFQI
jgi:hypothetical protein